MTVPSGGASSDIAIDVNGNREWSGTVSPGESTYASITGTHAGEVNVYSENSEPFMVSQRVYTTTGFSENYGVVAGEILDDYEYTWNSWIDGLAKTNYFISVLPTAALSDVVLEVGGVTHWSVTLSPGETLFKTISGTHAGPVRVYSTNASPFIASQRVYSSTGFTENY